MEPIAFGIVVQSLFLTIHMKDEPVKITCNKMLPYCFFFKSDVYSANSFQQKEMHTSAFLL